MLLQEKMENPIKKNKQHSWAPKRTGQQRPSEKNDFNSRPRSAEGLRVRACMLIIEQTFLAACYNTVTFCLASFAHTLRQGDEPDAPSAPGLPGTARICVLQATGLKSSFCLYGIPEPPVPVIVSIAQRPDRNFESLPHRVQSVLHHFCLVADGVSAGQIQRCLQVTRCLHRSNQNSASPTQHAAARCSRFPKVLLLSACGPKVSGRIRVWSVWKWSHYRQ